MYAKGHNINTVMDILRKEYKGVSIINDLCKYRGPNGTKCIIGCFIPDENYDESYEDLSILDLFSTLRSLLPIQNLDALIEIQEYHDACLFYQQNISVEEQLKLIEERIKFLEIRYAV